MQEISGPTRDYRIQSLALNALQEASESMLVTEFECKYFSNFVAFILILIL
jgi:histone H3/H4